MLFQENRLKKNADFQNVFKKGRSASARIVFIKFAPNNKKIIRIGFSVGLNFSKKAVARNRIKRQMREILRKKEAEIQKGWDLVFMVKPLKEEIDGKILKNDIENALKKGKLII
jgi:ribonuclease P protein component